MIDINKLRQLAQAATPGPWKMLPVGDGRQKFAVADSEFLSILTVTDEGGATFGTVYDDDDARFIAAANPATAIELLDRLEAAEKEIESWKGLAKQFGNEADALRAKVAEMEKRLRLILEEPENTMSNGKAMREMVKQARLALGASK